MSHSLKTDDVGDENRTTSLGLTSWDDARLLEPTWSNAVIFRIAAVLVLMLLILLGNVVVVVTIVRRAELRHKHVNVFIVNLAVGDLMVCFFVASIQIPSAAFDRWVLGPVACKLIPYVQLVTIASTTFLLTAMSIDRYQAIVQPLKFFGGTHNIRRQVVCSWLLAAICSAPQLLVMVQTEERHLSSDASHYVLKYKCKSAGYTTALQRKIYFTFQTAMFLVVPAGTMMYCYAHITRRIWLRADAQRAGNIDQPRIHFVTSRRPGSDSAVRIEPIRSRRPRPPHDGSTPSTPQPSLVSVPRRMIFKTKLSIIKMSMTVTVGFLVCYTPFFIVSLIRIYSDYRYTLTAALTVSKVVAIGHSAVNPVLYLIFSTRAGRPTFVQPCQSRCCRLRQRDHGPAAFIDQQRPNRSPRPDNARAMNPAGASRSSRHSDQVSAPEMRQLATYSRQQGCHDETGNRATREADSASHYFRHSVTTGRCVARPFCASSYD